jgi:hypothetical protein
MIALARMMRESGTLENPLRRDAGVNKAVRPFP